jgi:hypothetical protein
MVDEKGYGKPLLHRIGVRSSVMTSLQLNCMALGRHTPIDRIRNLGFWLRYGLKYGMTRKKKVPVDVEALTDQWITAIVGMCQCHDKDEYDAHDAKSDKLLGPLLSASSKDVRAFYFRMLEKMKTDKRIPFVVWIAFEAWGKVSVEDAPDEGVKRMKRKLAAEIAEMVDEPIRDQIPNAIKRALMWRDESTLKAVKETLESGKKPKLRGRESCLFLEAGRGAKKISVML